MSFTVRTDYKTRKSLLAVKKLPGQVQKSLQETFEDFGSILVRTGINQGLNESKYGLPYKRYEGGVRKLPDHIASAAGQAPAVLSGEYSESFGYEARGSKEMEFGNTADYAGFLEDGTENMAPRPGVLNAVKASLGTFRTMSDDNLEQAMNLES